MAASDEAPSGPPPYELEQFEVVEEVGKGSFGIVKQVKKRDTGEIFAMKVLGKQGIVERKMQEQLKREVLTQLKVRHPHVVQLHYYFEDKCRIYCLLEYADGGQLFRYLRAHEGGLPEPRAASFFADSARGLEYLHAHGIAHRDLKPENVLLFGPELRAKIGDLGWCVELTQDAPSRRTFCGTLDYLAPEMLQGQPHGMPIDLWALGVLLFEMLMARAPFTADSQMKTMERICSADFEIPRGTITQEAEDVIRSLIVSDAGSRASASEVLRRPWLGDGGRVCADSSTAAKTGDASVLDETCLVRSGAEARDAPQLEAARLVQATLPLPVDVAGEQGGEESDAKPEPTDAPRAEPLSESAPNVAHGSSDIDCIYDDMPVLVPCGGSKHEGMHEELMQGALAFESKELLLASKMLSEDLISSPGRRKATILDSDLLSTVDDSRVSIDDIDDELHSVMHKGCSPEPRGSRLSSSMVDRSTIDEKLRLDGLPPCGKDRCDRDSAVVRCAPRAKMRSSRRSRGDR